MGQWTHRDQHARFAELVRGRGREVALPCKVEYLVEVVQLSVRMRMKAKAKGEIDIESVKGKRWSCPSPFLHELAYDTLRIRACGANLSRDMKQDAGDSDWATTYPSFPSKIVSNVVAYAAVQRSKRGSFSTRSAESVAPDFVARGEEQQPSLNSASLQPPQRAIHLPKGPFQDDFADFTNADDSFYSILESFDASTTLVDALGLAEFPQQQPATPRNANTTSGRLIATTTGAKGKGQMSPWDSS